jgi:hypothetical protein
MDGFLKTLIDSGYLGKGLESHIGEFANSEKFEARGADVGIISFSRIIMISLIVFYYIWKKKDMYVGGIGLVYLFLQVMNFLIPIMFRFRQYFDMYFYVMFSFVIIDISSGRYKQIRNVIIAFCIAFFSLFPTIEYMYKYPGSPYRYIHQYYPYHSIFNPDVDRKKLDFFKWLG